MESFISELIKKAQLDVVSEMYDRVHAERDELKEKCTNLQRERDQLQHFIDCANTPLMAIVMRERDGWKARAEQLQEELDARRWAAETLDFLHKGCQQELGKTEARVAVLEKALTEIAYEMPVEERNPDGDEQAAYSMQLAAREALAVPGRPGSGAPAESESGYMDAGGWNS